MKRATHLLKVGAVAIDKLGRGGLARRSVNRRGNLLLVQADALRQFRRGRSPWGIRRALALETCAQRTIILADLARGNACELGAVAGTSRNHSADPDDFGLSALRLACPGDRLFQRV
jgi:hypothetical protein